MYQKLNWLGIQTAPDGSAISLASSGVGGIVTLEKSPFSFSAHNVIVAASAENYGLMLDLYSSSLSRSKQESFKLYSCRPSPGSNSAYARLCSLCSLTPCDTFMNGWLRVDNKVATTYALLHSYNTVGCDFVTAALADKHCVVRAISRHYHISPQYFLPVIALIVDPRWFLSTLKPGRLSKLFYYFGLGSREGVTKTQNRRRQTLTRLSSKLPVSSYFHIESSFRDKPIEFVVLDYISRKWLSHLNKAYEFDEDRFFRSELAKHKYHQIAKNKS